MGAIVGERLEDPTFAISICIESVAMKLAQKLPEIIFFGVPTIQSSQLLSNFAEPGAVD